MSIHYINSRLGTVTQNVKRGLLMNPGNWWHPVVTSLGRRWAILSQWAFKCENHRRKFTVFFMFQPCLIRSPESTVVGNTQSYPNHIPIISQSYPTCCVPVVTWQPQPSPLPSPRSYELEELARRPNQQLARWMTANPPVTDVFKSSGIVPLIPWKISLKHHYIIKHHCINPDIIDILTP